MTVRPTRRSADLTRSALHDGPPHVKVRGGSVLAAAALGAALTPLNSTMVAVALPA